MDEWFVEKNEGGQQKLLVHTPAFNKNDVPVINLCMVLQVITCVIIRQSRLRVSDHNRLVATVVDEISRNERTFIENDDTALSNPKGPS